MQLAQWQVKHICIWIGAQAMVDTSKHGGKNPLVEMARDIDIFADTEEDPRQKMLREVAGEKVADNWEDDPRIARKVAADPEKGVEAENSAGSYEQFLRLMGVPPEQIAAANGTEGPS